LPFATFADQLVNHKLTRVPGTAIFMYSSSTSTPPALLHNLKHNRVVHERVVILSVETADTPHVPADQRIEVHELGNGMYRAVLHYGFMEDPDVPRDLRLARRYGLVLKPFELSYFLGRERVIATKRKGMAIWRERLFGLMTRNSRSATDFFRLPPNQVVELGSQVEM
jgi:KUP system potassium uptake protein